MTDQHFEAQIRRLIDQYGAQHYKLDRTRLLHKTCASLDDRDITAIIDELIGHCRQAPMLQEFQEIISRIKGQRYQNRPREPHFTPSGSGCGYCSDSGTYLAIRDGEDGFYAFRCHCSRGDRDPRTHIPQFKAEHRDQGFRFCEIRKPRKITAEAAS